MQLNEKIKKYCDSVCSQIRWKKARADIYEEIKNHIIDQKEAYKLEGEEEELAVEKAIKQMGNPITIGVELDKTHRPKTPWSMLGITIVLFLLGYSARFLGSAENSQNIFAAFLSFLGAIGIFFLLYYTDLSIIGKYSKSFWLTIILLSALGILFCSNSNQRNIAFTEEFVFPLYYFAYLFPPAFAAFLYSLKDKGYLGILFSGLGYIGFTILLISMSALSGVFVFSIIAFCLLCIAILKGWFHVKKLYGILLVIIPTILITVTGIFGIVLRTDRWKIAIYPELQELGAGYLATIIRGIIKNAKVIGQGVLPNGYCEEMIILSRHPSNLLLTKLIFYTGWISFFVIFGICIMFIMKGFFLCFKQKTILGLLLSFSIMGIFTCEIVTYILNNIGFTFFSANLQPFVSDTNMGILLQMGLMGILLSVFRNGDILISSKVK